MRRITSLAAGIALSLAVAAPVSADWPVASKDSRVSQWFHKTRHAAIDIAAPLGTPVIAAQSGKVNFAGYRYNCGGYQVYVWTGNGHFQAYYHMLSNLRVKRLDYVRRGQVIGFVGSSGKPPSWAPNMTCSTGPHLHFEQWHGRPWSRYAWRFQPWPYIDHGKYLPDRYR